MCMSELATNTNTAESTMGIASDVTVTMAGTSEGEGKAAESYHRTGQPADP